MKTIRRHLLFQQSFLSPLQTAKGVWSDRTSLVLREDDCDGRTSFGEFAPMPGSSYEILMKPYKKRSYGLRRR